MPGALTEYNKFPDSWRALPFSAGSLFYSVSSLAIQSLPMGVAVRASEKLDSVLNFCFRLASINYHALGTGDVVGSWTLNGSEVKYSLQIPENLLRFGKNTIQVERCKSYQEFRLFSSTALLLDIHENNQQISYFFSSPLGGDIVFENDQNVQISVKNADSNALKFERIVLKDCGKTLYRIDSKGDFIITASLK